MARAPSNRHSLHQFIREVHLVEKEPTTPTKTSKLRRSLIQSLSFDANDDHNYGSDDDKGPDEGYSANDTGHYDNYGDDDDQDHQEEDGLCLTLSSLSNHPKTEAEAQAHVTRVRRLDPHRDQVKYMSAVDHFHANWIKNNATHVTVESVLEVISNQQAKFEAYKAAIASRQLGHVAERVLYHGTNSCQGRYHYTLQDGFGNNDVLQQLCYKADCATCGILAFGFDLSKSGQGSRDRGARVWQRFGDGIYFSPNSSKCHFYSKTGNTGYHPTTKKNFGTMIVAKVVLGKPYHPQSAGKVEETWKTPPAGHDSVVARAGDGIVVYEENVVYTPSACLPTAVITYSFTSTIEYC
ncbi:hypothetical protein BG003_009581 [Podila horticola]|nr:hypothetical protein BG003_009581 [Podila horticola]